MSRIELLAPAGSMDSLIAAVQNGADAVYFGGKSFNARQFAGNFSDDEIGRAIDYCHVRGVKAYVTVNILLKDPEIKELPGVIEKLYNAGADALIIQDLGAGEIIRKLFPDFELHASTQMTAHNLEGVNLLYHLGYKRVVLSRELSFKEIQYISQNTNAEIEVFSHGALCICYSGQCLMSSMIGGRSGNRGRCAQPCRMKYTLEIDGVHDRSGYLLSPKDLCTIEYIDKFAECNVRSLKVEGRMKSPQYVAQVISSYRRAIDYYNEHGTVKVPEDDKKNLISIFNRGGFTTAHLLARAGSEMMSEERPKNWGIYAGRILKVYPDRRKAEVLLDEDLSIGDGIEVWTKDKKNPGFTVRSIIKDGKPVEKASRGMKVDIEYRGGRLGDKIYKTLDAKLDESLRASYSLPDAYKKIPLWCTARVRLGEPVEIIFRDHEGNTANIKGPVPEKAVKIALTEARLKEQLRKLGGTPFYIKDISIDMDSGLSLPLSVLNALRRQGVSDILNSRAKKFKHNVVLKDKGEELFIKKQAPKVQDVRLSVFVRDSSQVKGALDGGADIIIFGGDRLRGYDFDFDSAIRMCREKGIQIYIASPRIVKMEFGSIAAHLKDCISKGADGIYVQDLGMLKYVMDEKIPFSCGFSFNIFNYASARLMTEMGSGFVSLSPELTVKEIKYIAPYIENCEALCYGRAEMMVSEHCPVHEKGKKCTDKGSALRCSAGEIYLSDRLDKKFPVKTDIYCRAHIFNSASLSMLENIKDLISGGVNILRLNMLDEDQDETYAIVEAFRNISDHAAEGKAVKESSKMVIEGMKGPEYTKGNYYRGVE